MSTNESIHVDGEDEYEERARELIEDTRETKEELDAKQEDALDAIADGDDFGDYEPVTLGELEMERKTWLPGDVTDVVKDAAEVTQRLQEKPDDEVDPEDFAALQESMTTMLEALAGLTRSDDYDLSFWQAFYERYGPEGLMLAVERIVAPAVEGLEDRRDGMDSFHRGEGD